MKELYFSFSLFYRIVYQLELFKKANSIDELYEITIPLVNKKELEKIENIRKSLIEKMLQAKIGVLTYYDSDYPVLLKEIYEPPLVLFYIGNRNIFQKQFVSVVGTRKPSKISVVACNLIPDFLSRFRGSGIVSGMAMGIDRAVSLAALDSGIPVVGVLGTDLLTEYPYTNRDLYSKMKKSDHALLVSEMKIGEPMGKWSFPKRNRIIAGMSATLIVMEAPLKSGAISSASHAISQNREVMIFVDENQKFNQGGMKLVEDGAKKLTILDLNGNNQSIFHISEILPGSYEKTSGILSWLQWMELKGAFRELGGGYYQRV